MKIVMMKIIKILSLLSKTKFSAINWRRIGLKLGAITCVGICLAIASKLSSCWLRKYALTYWLQRPTFVGHEAIRTSFRNLTLTEPAKRPSHNHGDLAAARAAARVNIKNFFVAYGQEPYYSGVDDVVEAGIKTIGQRPISSNTDRPLVLIDDDYYRDMPAECLDGRLLVGYTMSPVDAADVGQMNYRFDKDSNLIVDIAGGGHYKHKLWNYVYDQVFNFGVRWNSMHPILKYVHSSIDLRRVDETHILFLITPKYVYSGFDALVAYCAYGLPQTLKRLVCVDSDYVRLHTIGPAGLTVSTAPLGSYNCITLEKSVDDGLRSIVAKSKEPVQVAVLASYLGGRANAKLVASALVGYYNSGAIPEPYNIGMLVYEHRNKNVVVPDLVKTALVPYMGPLVPGAYVPSLTPGNAAAAIEGRVLSRVNQVTMTTTMDKRIDMFIKKLVRHKILPMTQDEVYDRQDSIVQRLLLDDAIKSGTATGSIASFIKREAYQDAKDPRIITPSPPLIKLEYSRYTYAISELLKEHKWYMIGKNPAHIALMVTELCANAKQFVQEADISRLDGSISYVFRELDRRIAFACFYPDDYSEYEKWQKRSYDNVLNMETYLEQLSSYPGIKYEQGAARGSGNPETSEANTAATAFIIFNALLDKGYSVDAAYERLGVVYGDDSLTADLDNITESAATLGMTVVSTKRERGDCVTFLSRVFGPHVWCGDASSMCDLARALTKFHLCVSFTNPKLKLCEKALAYWFTDENTPIIGDYVKKVLTVSERWSGSRDRGNFFARYPKEVQFPNVDIDGWMTVEAMCSLKCDFVDLCNFKDWLAKCTTLDDLMRTWKWLPSQDIVDQSPIEITSTSGANVARVVPTIVGDAPDLPVVERKRFDAADVAVVATPGMVKKGIATVVKKAGAHVQPKSRNKPSVMNRRERRKPLREGYKSSLLTKL